MGKVKQDRCQDSGCTSAEDGGAFITDEDCATVTERTTELKKHSYQVHQLRVDQHQADAAEAAKVSAAATRISAEADKV